MSHWTTNTQSPDCIRVAYWHDQKRVTQCRDHCRRVILVHFYGLRRYLGSFKNKKCQIKKIHW